MNENTPKITRLLVPLVLLAVACGDSTSPEDSANMNGIWFGAWSSSISSSNGSLIANIVQQGSSLVGSIDLPEGDMYGEQLTGIVNGYEISFGDIAQQITFTGTVQGDTLASGAYEDHTSEDSGTWEASKNPVDGTLTIVSAFDSPGSMPSGLTFADGSFWVSVAGSEIFNVDTQGNIISSFSILPGLHASDLTYDRMYLWGTAHFDHQIHEFDTSGNVIATFSSPGTAPTGLAFDGVHLWNADSSGRIYKLDTSGNTLVSFVSPGPCPNGLAFDGAYLWNIDIDAGKIYKFDRSGKTVSTYDSPGGYLSCGIEYALGYLWLADWTEAKIYKLRIG